MIYRDLMTSGHLSRSHFAGIERFAPVQVVGFVATRCGILVFLVRELYDMNIEAYLTGMRPDKSSREHLVAGLMRLHHDLLEQLKIAHCALKPTNYFVLRESKGPNKGRPYPVLSDFYMSVHLDSRYKHIPHLKQLGRERRWIGPELSQENFRMVQSARRKATPRSELWTPLAFKPQDFKQSDIFVQACVLRRVLSAEDYKPEILCGTNNVTARATPTLPRNTRHLGPMHPCLLRCQDEIFIDGYRKSNWYFHQGLKLMFNQYTLFRHSPVMRTSFGSQFLILPTGLEALDHTHDYDNPLDECEYCG